MISFNFASLHIYIYIYITAFHMTRMYINMQLHTLVQKPSGSRVQLCVQSTNSHCIPAWDTILAQYLIGGFNNVNLFDVNEVAFSKHGYVCYVRKLVSCLRLISNSGTLATLHWHRLKNTNKRIKINLHDQVSVHRLWRERLRPFAFQAEAWCSCSPYHNNVKLTGHPAVPSRGRSAQKINPAHLKRPYRAIQQNSLSLGLAWLRVTARPTTPSFGNFFKNYFKKCVP